MVFALSNDDGAPARVQKQGSGGGNGKNKANSTPPTGYTVASLADREKQLWEAKQVMFHNSITLSEAGVVVWHARHAHPSQHCLTPGILHMHS